MFKSTIRHIDQKINQLTTSISLILQASHVWPCPLFISRGQVQYFLSATHLCNWGLPRPLYTLPWEALSQQSLGPFFYFLDAFNHFIYKSLWACSWNFLWSSRFMKHENVLPFGFGLRYCLGENSVAIIIFINIVTTMTHSQGKVWPEVRFSYSSPPCFR